MLCQTLRLRGLVAALLLLWTIPAAPAASPGEETTAQGLATVAAVPVEMPTVGNPDALVTMIIVSEFQCPFCSRVMPTLTRLVDVYGDRVRMVWANNPLSFHKRAVPAALAALAAHRQGLFWRMHEKLFNNQRQLTDENLARWAVEVGCDLDTWKRDMADPVLRQQIEIERRAAVAVGARGTPSFLINGKRISGAQPYKKFADEIDAALAAAAGWESSGKRGLELMEAMWSQRAGEKGARAVEWFFAGVAPPVPAPKPVRTPRPDLRRFLKVPVHQRDEIEGNSHKALVTIVEFSDLQCPFCSRVAKTLKQLRKEYGDQIRIVYKHHPLSFHSKAKPAHLAAIAAGRQGKFLAYRDKAFANQRQLTEANLVKWAGELGLRMKTFERDRKSAHAKAKVKKDTALAESLGLRGTPSFVINGRQLRGAQPAPAFRKLIDEEISKARALRKRGKSYYRWLMAHGK